jgi:hypothetical protein
MIIGAPWQVEAFLSLRCVVPARCVIPTGAAFQAKGGISRGTLWPAELFGFWVAQCFSAAIGLTPQEGFNP